jgi:hypothetical protein
VTICSAIGDARNVQGLTVTTNERLVFFVNFLRYLKDLATPGLEKLKQNLGGVMRQGFECNVLIVERTKDGIVHRLGTIDFKAIRDVDCSENRLDHVRN